MTRKEREPAQHLCTLRIENQTELRNLLNGVADRGTAITNKEAVSINVRKIYSRFKLV